MRLTAEETMLVNLPSLRRYDLTKKLQAQPATIADMTDEQRREYMRQAKARSRAKQREAAAAGTPLPTKDAVRDALADAALMLIAVDGPGAAQIETVLHKAFPSKPGKVLKLIGDIQKGKIRPKLVRL